MANNTKKEECKVCEDYHGNPPPHVCPNSPFIDKNKEEECLKCMGKNRILADGICLMCSLLEIPSPQSPLGDWEIEFDKLWQSLEPEVCTRVKTHNTHRLEDYVPLESDDIKNFIRITRLEAQREVIEKIRKASIWKLVPNTPRMVMCKDSELDELLRGLLPKITE